jgi:hypothetical protein
VLEVELLPATYGDCILLSYGEQPVRHVLIDAGTTQVWSDALKPHLQQRGIERLELLVLSHVDADHIAGAIPMLEDPELPVEVGEVWFNGWRHLPKRVLSIRQGERFSDLIEELGIPWNACFDGRAVCVGSGTLPVHELPGDLRLTVLSPDEGRLVRLARAWKKEVDRHFNAGGRGPLLRPRFLARNPTTSTDVPALARTRFRTDTSVPNGSSIALLAEHGDARVLLAADAHAPVLSRSIRAWLADRGAQRMELDALKVSHHGSRGNTSVPLLELLECPRYLISCNGDVHNLPDNEAIGRIVQHGGERPRLYFNYRSERTECWDDPALRRRYRYDTEYGDAGYLRLGLASE